MPLRYLLDHLREEVAAMDVAGMIQELLAKFFGEYGLPVPKLKFANKANAKSLAHCKWHAGATNTELEIQKSVLGDDATLRRVLTHELIHHWQFLRTDQTQELKLAALKLNSDGHGEDFVAYAAKINAVMGPGYVSKSSDGSYDTSKVPAFYILIQPHTDGRYGYSVALRPSAKQKIEIQDRIATKQARLFRITDGALWTGATPIKRLGGYTLTRDPESARTLTLKKLYTSGEAVTL